MNIGIRAVPAPVEIVGRVMVGDTALPGTTTVTISGLDGSRTINTDLSGYFALGSLTYGTYQVSVPPTIDIDGRGSYTTSTSVWPVTLNEQSPRVFQSFSYTYTGPVATIRGTVFADVNMNGVKDAGEEGLPNRTLTVAGPAGTFTVATDGTGAYEIHGAEGDYAVRLRTDEGYPYGTLPVADASGLMQRSYTGVLQSHVINSADFGLAPAVYAGADKTGIGAGAKAYSSDGLIGPWLVSGQTVTVTAATSSGLTYTATGMTDEYGSVLFVVPPGPHTVTMTPSADYSARDGSPLSVTYTSDWFDFQLESSTTPPATVALVGVFLSTTSDDHMPLTNFTVTATADDGTTTSCLTGADGTCRITTGAPGNYTLSIDATGYGTPVKGSSAPRELWLNPGLNDAVWFHVGGGAGWVSVHVFEDWDFDGVYDQEPTNSDRDVDGFYPVAIKLPGNAYIFDQAYFGRYNVDYLPGDADTDYTVVLPVIEPWVAATTGVTSGTGRVTLTYPNAGSQYYDFGLTKAARPDYMVSGHVYEADGKTPVAGVSVEVWDDQPAHPYNRFDVTVTTDANGAYSLMVPDENSNMRVRVAAVDPFVSVSPLEELTFTVPTTGGVVRDFSVTRRTHDLCAVVKDASGTAVAGASVTMQPLFGAADPVTVTSNAVGEACGTGLAAGDWAVTVRPAHPFNTVVGQPTRQVSLTRALVEEPTFIVGRKWVTVTGVAFHDYDNDGVHDDGEPVFGGQTVALWTPYGQPAVDAAGVPVPAATTASDGSYSFSYLPSLLEGQSYTVRSDASDAHAAGAATTTEDLSVDGATATANVGLPGWVHVDGTVWKDSDGDGARGATEVGWPNVEVRVWGPTGTLVTSVTTDTAGHYVLPPLLVVNFDQTYRVEVVPPTSTAVTAGGGAVKADQYTGMTFHGEELTFDYGLTETMSLSGVAFVDVVRNGAIDSSEPYIPNVALTVLRLDSTGGIATDVFGTQVTAATGSDGTYAVTNLPMGSYLVTPTYPLGYEPSGEGESGTGRGAVVAPIVGAAPPVNFAMYPTPVAVSGAVFFDDDGDGILGGTDVLVEALLTVTRSDGTVVTHDALGQLLPTMPINSYRVNLPLLAEGEFYTVSVVHDVLGMGSVRVAGDVATSVEADIALLPYAPVLNVTCPADAVYDGQPHPCQATVTGSASVAPAEQAVLTYTRDGVETTDLTSAGTVVATANYGGDGVYIPAVSDPVTFTIAKAASSISVSCPAAVPASGSAIEPCTATVSGVGVPADAAATLVYSENTAVGTATVTATWSDANHEASTGSGSFAIVDAATQLTPALSLTCPTNAVYTGAEHQCSASVVGSGAAAPSGSASVSYTRDGAATTDLISAGTIVATASYAGDATYTAASSEPVTFTIAKAASAVLVACPASVDATGSAVEPCTATVSGVGIEPVAVPVTYANNTLAGTASASASFAGDANHLPGQHQVTFTIVPWTLTPTGALASSGALTPGSTLDLTFTVTAGGTSLTDGSVVAPTVRVWLLDASGNPVGEPTVTTPTTTYAGGQFVAPWTVPTAEGQYLVELTTADGSSLSATFTVSANPVSAVATVSLTCPSGAVYNATPIECVATVTGSGAVAPTGVATIGCSRDGAATTDLTSAGTIVATASYPGDATHAAASSESVTFTIAKARSTVTVSCPTVPVNFTGSEITPCTATATGVGIDPPISVPVDYRDNTLVGVATATAEWAGDANHEAALGSGTFTIAPAPTLLIPEMALTCPSGAVFNATPFACATTVSGSGAVAPTGVATIGYSRDGTATTDLTSAGTIVATASYPGDSVYGVATQSVTFTIAKARATVTVSCPTVPVNFTGSEITPCTASVTGDGVPAGTAATLVYSGNVAVGTATVTATWSDVNHEASTGHGSFTIATAPTREPRPTREPSPTREPGPTQEPSPISSPTQEPSLASSPSSSSAPSPSSSSAPSPSSSSAPSPSSSRTPSQLPSSTPVPNPTSSPSPLPWVLLALGLGGAFGLIWIVRRRREEEEGNG